MTPGAAIPDLESGGLSRKHRRDSDGVVIGPVAPAIALRAATWPCRDHEGQPPPASLQISTAFFASDTPQCSATVLKTLRSHLQ